MKIILILSVLLSLLAPVLAASGRNPCHSNRRIQGNGQESCLRYVIPKKMCVACRLRPYNKGGRFRNCGNIYYLYSPWCRSQLKLYAKMNPCDKLRNKQVRNFRNKGNVMGLDYFVYSICEMCCDCVPRKTLPGQFDIRKKNSTLLKADRANCPAHAVADICKVWPNVRAVYTENDYKKKQMAPFWKLARMPKMCTELRNWKKRQTKSLYNVDQIGITKKMRSFFDEFLNAANCRDKRLWNSCVALEKSQRRI